MAWTRTLVGGASSVGAGSPATFTTLSLTADTSQVVLDSDGTNPVTLTIVAPTAPRTISLPNATDTLVGKTTVDTLTNKTLTAPIISTISNTGTLTLPTSTDTLVGKATTDTLTNKSLTSPVITTGTVAADPVVALGIASKQYADTYKPTVTFKTGSGAGDYTTTSTTYADVDGTNLAYTVTVPTGSKILIHAVANVTVSANTFRMALADGTTTLVETPSISLTGASAYNGSVVLAYVFTGDGASHTFKLRWLINVSGTATMANSTATLKPQMTFWLGAAS